MGFTITQQGNERNLVITNSVMTISSEKSRHSYDVGSATELTVRENTINGQLYALPFVGLLVTGFGYLYFQSGSVSPEIFGSFFLLLGLGLVSIPLISYLRLTEGDRITVTFDNGSTVEFVLADGNTEAITSAFRNASGQTVSERLDEVQNEKT